jgi:hypothetical protein
MTRLGIREVEAGNRTQTDIRYGVTLALMGSSYDETEPRKATYPENKAYYQYLDLTGVQTRSIIHSIAVRVLGFQWLKWLHLRELIIIQGNE